MLTSRLLTIERSFAALVIAGAHQERGEILETINETPLVLSASSIDGMKDMHDYLLGNLQTLDEHEVAKLDLERVDKPNAVDMKQHHEVHVKTLEASQAKKGWLLN